MALRIKLGVVILAVMAGLLALHVGIFRHVVLPSFSALEEHQIVRNLLRVTNAVEREVADVEVFGVDWAYWDDTHQFVQDGNDRYRDVNLVPELFQQTKLTVIFILDAQGRTVWGRAEHPETNQPLSFSALPAKGLPPDHPLLRPAREGESVAGLLATEHGPLIIASHPVLRSSGKGPKVGNVLMGRLVSSSLIAKIEDVVQMSVDIWTGDQVPAAHRGPLSRLEGVPPRASAAVDDHEMSTYTAIRDVYGNPAIFIHAVMTRELVKTGQTTATFALALAAFSGLVVVGALLLLIEGMVLRPLVAIKEHVSRLPAFGSNPPALALARTDEIGTVAAGIDDLVASLSATAREKDAARTRLLDGIEALPGAFALWDAEDRLVLANQRYAAFFPAVADLLRPGIAFADMARAAVEREMVNRASADVEDWLERRRQMHANPGQPVEYELTDGRWIEIIERRTAEGGVLSIYSDVTARKTAEVQLQAMLHELERSNAELEQFAYIASHDLQEPLRMVASYTQLLKRRYEGSLDKDADDFIGFAVEGAKRMQTLINDLLAYSRVDRRGRPFQPAEVSSALEAALANLRSAIADKDAAITHGPLPVVLADRGQLVQLLQNLVGNAIKYARPGVSPRIHVEAAADGDRWRISVRDNGIGIDPQYAERIFMIFQRLHTRDEYPGTGIGLAICKKIVERHGGRVWVESEPGQGSAFFFTMAQASMPSEAAADDAIFG